MSEAKPCGCGRSPTGNCIGWHGLTNEEFQDKLSAYNNKKLDESTKKFLKD